MTDDDDADLWRRMQDDDADAFRLLFQRHGARLHRFALRRTGDPTVADDAVAVVFLEAWRLRHRVDLQRDTALPWLYGVTTNVLRRWSRSRRRHAAAVDALAALPEPTPALVERQVLAAAEAGAVLDQIRHLPRRDREVLVLSVWEGLSHAEIAVALDISEGTVKSRLSRARARLDRDRPSPATPAARPHPTDPPKRPTQPTTVVHRPTVPVPSHPTITTEP
jgi:RNA polymerase sigma-70 factor (ECF subfamily)